MKRRDDIIKDLQSRLAEGDAATIIPILGPFGGIDTRMKQPFIIWGGNTKARERALKAALRLIEAEKKFLEAILYEMFDDGWQGRTADEQRAELRRRAIARRAAKP